MGQEETVDDVLGHERDMYHFIHRHMQLLDEREDGIHLFMAGERGVSAPGAGQSGT